MALTGVDKVKLNKYLKEHANGDIYYIDMCDYLGKRGKISDVEFLDFFTESAVLEFRKDTKISMKQVSKYISVIDSFLGWVHESGSEVSEETLDKIRSLKEFYFEYVERTEGCIDVEFNDNYLVPLMEKIDALYPVDDNYEAESVSNYINKIAELEKTIKVLERELDELRRKSDSLESSSQKKDEQLDTLKEEKVSLGREVKAKNKEIEELSGTIESLKVKISELQTLLDDITSDRDALVCYKVQFDEVSSQVAELTKTINAYKKEKNKAEKQKQKDEKIESLIYQKLIVQDCSLDDLLRAVDEAGIKTSSEEVSRLLKQMKSKINIDSSRFSTSPRYKIVKPKVMQDGTFTVDVPYGCKHMDIMLVSDFHIKEIDGKTLNSYDILLDYCTNNNINLILNLGDFYNGFSVVPLEYHNAVKNYKLTEEAIEKLPKADGIYHAVLGGNHDRNIANYGFDPIKMMADEREDFIDLGYFHSTVLLDGTLGVHGSFDLHHPEEFDFPISIDDEAIIGYMDGYLNDMYKGHGRDRNDSYIDIIGHTHRNQFNYSGGYCYIPPFLSGPGKKGASHLRIYFDEETGIKYMVFMPLSYNTKLVKNTEIVYQKILSR